MRDCEPQELRDLIAGQPTKSTDRDPAKFLSDKDSEPSPWGSREPVVLADPGPPQSILLTQNSRTPNSMVPNGPTPDRKKRGNLLGRH